MTSDRKLEASRKGSKSWIYGTEQTMGVDLGLELLHDLEELRVDGRVRLLARRREF